MLESSDCHSIQHGCIVTTIALEGDVTEYVARSNMQGLLVKGVPASITHIAKCSEMWAGKHEQWPTTPNKNCTSSLISRRLGIEKSENDSR